MGRAMEWATRRERASEKGRLNRPGEHVPVLDRLEHAFPLVVAARRWCLIFSCWGSVASRSALLGRSLRWEHPRAGRARSRQARPLSRGAGCLPALFACRALRMRSTFALVGSAPRRRATLQETPPG